MKVLNVGGGGNRQLPAFYEGWEQAVLDIDPAVQPDILCNALDLESLPAAGYQAIYCAHNLEHFYKHEIPRVLKGFLHLLIDDGFVEVHVPDLNGVFRAMAEHSLDISDTWYRIEGRAITFHDVLFGWNHAMSAGNLFYAHKCGFTALSLSSALYSAGFGTVWVKTDGENLSGYAYRKENVPCP